jgi:hypothetical protein
VPFFFEPAHLIGTVCGGTGTGAACDTSSSTTWREEHLRGAKRIPRPIQSIRLSNALCSVAAFSGALGL